jgi:hypothetical protein
VHTCHVSLQFHLVTSSIMPRPSASTCQEVMAAVPHGWVERSEHLDNSNHTDKQSRTCDWCKR